MGTALGIAFVGRHFGYSRRHARVGLAPLAAPRSRSSAQHPLPVAAERTCTRSLQLRNLAAAALSLGLERQLALAGLLDNSSDSDKTCNVGCEQGQQMESGQKDRRNDGVAYGPAGP